VSKIQIRGNLFLFEQCLLNSEWQTVLDQEHCCYRYQSAALLVLRFLAQYQLEEK